MLRWAVLLLLSSAGLARAQVGLQVGPRGGVELGRDDVAWYAGAEARLSSPHSPLTIAVTLDKFFADEMTLYQIGGSALYHLPIRGRIAPYLGIGVNITSFTYEQGTPGIDDDQGNRVGMTLLAGARLDLGWVSPFVEVTQGVGEFDLLTVGGGLAFTVREERGPASLLELAPFVITPYVDNNVAGDVQSGRVGLGLSLAYYFRGKIGFELDAEVHGHFFRDEDVAHLVPEGVDLNTKAVLFSGNVVVPYCVGSASIGTWCPYATAGAGIVHAIFDGIPIMSGTDRFSGTQTNLTINGGVGVMHALTRHVGLRVDARYVHALVDEEAQEEGYVEDYGFLRLSVGVMVAFGSGSSPD